MANWYTDYVYGSDTIGNGTIVAPYQTIVKAITMATDGDTVNVAGTDHVAVAGTLTFTLGSNAITTSVDMTTTLPIGTVFTINDPSWGSRKNYFKVSAVSATTINVTANPYMASGTYSGIEKVRYGTGGLPAYYRTGTASTNFEDLTALNKNDIKIEGGWLNNFTSQTGTTWFVYTNSGLSGTVMRYTTGNMKGLSFNNIGVAGMTLGTASSNPSNTQKIGNINLVQATINLQYYVDAANGGCEMIIGNSCNVNGTSTGGGTAAPPFNINNIWYNSGSFFSSTDSQNFRITNFRVKATAANPYSGTGVLRYASFDIDNVIVDWTMPAASDQGFVLISNNAGNYIIRNIQSSGNYGGAGKRPIYLRNSAIPQVQIIAPTQNVDTWGIQQLAYILSPFSTVGFQPILDAEGEKQFFGAGGVVYADSTVYDTGTNSLRISKSNYTGGQSNQLVPIKSFYNANSAPKTITFRAKASAAGTVRCSVMPSGGIPYPGASYIAPDVQQFSMTTSWADYQYTFNSTLAGWANESYVNFAIAAEDWAGPYVWIDSVTIN